MLTATGWVILAAVPLIAWWLGSTGGRQTNGWRGYFLALGQLGTTSIAATYVGANLTFTAIFLILSEEAFKRGWWVLSVPIFWVLGTLLFVAAYPRLRPFLARGQTLHQAIADTFQSPSLQRWASVWTILGFTGTVALEFYGGIRLLQWAGVPLLVDVSLAMVLAFVVTAFTVSGGFRGVARADIWLDIVALVGTITLAYFLFEPSTHTSTEAVLPPQIGTEDNILFAIGMAIIFLPFQFCTLDSWQRIGAWQKREKNPALWLISGSVLLAIAYCVPIAIGVAVRETGTLGPGDHPLYAFLQQIQLPAILAGLVFAGFLAAVFSTADELLNCCSLSFLFDTLQVAERSEHSESERLRIVSSGKFYTAVFAVVSAAIALLAVRFEREVSDMAFAVFSGQIVFIWPILGLLFWPHLAPKVARAAMWAMLLAFVTSLSLVVAGWMVHDRQLTEGAPLAAFLIETVVLGSALAWAAWRNRRGR